MILIRVFLVRLVEMNRLDVGAQVAAHQVGVLADQLGRSVDAVLRKGDLQRDHVDDGRIAEFLRLGFAGFGDHGELHDALLQRHHALDGAADDAQIDILERVDADFFQAHFEGEFGSGAGDVSAADFAFQILRSFDARLRNQIVGQHVDVAGDGDDVAAGEPRAGESGSAAFADGNFSGEDRLECRARCRI